MARCRFASVVRAWAALLVTGCAAAGPAVQEGYVPGSDDVALYWRAVGDGPETVVIPVGFYLEDALAPLAGSGRRLVFYDPRGRGRSGAGDRSRVTLDTQLEDLESLRDALGIERMALIGWSGLGMELAVYTLRHPERVTRLVQVAPVPPRMQPHGVSANATRLARIDTAALASLARRWSAGELTDEVAYCRERARLLRPAMHSDPDAVDGVPDVCVHANEMPDSLAVLFGSLLGSFGDYDWRAELAALDVPRLVIHGAEDAFPVEGSREWVAGHPAARLLVLEGAGHFPFLDRPDAFHAAVDAFLDGGWPADAGPIP